MRVGGGRILLDGYEIRLYFFLEWFVRFLPWETVRQISISLHVVCVYHVTKDEQD